MPALTSIAIGAGLLGAGSGIAGSIIQGNAASDAAGMQLQGNRESIAAQLAAQEKAIAAQREASANAIAAFKEQAGIARKDLEPFRQAQLSAVQQLQGLADPNNKLYTQQRDKATQAIQMQLAAQGLLRSKNQTDLLTDLELGLTQQRQNALSGLAGLGAAQNMASISSGLGGQLGGLYQTQGANLGSTFQQTGSALAQGALNSGGILGQMRLAQAQALAGGLGSVTNAAQGTVGNLVALKNQQDQMALLSGLLNR